MDVYIYFFSDLPVSRDAIEDTLDKYLGERGEVTGGGSGEGGSNLDLEIFEGDARNHLPAIRKILRRFKVPPDTQIVIEGEKEPYSVY